MEHQSIQRTEPIPEDAKEFLTPQPDPEVITMFGKRAIDSVRACGWYNYEGDAS